MWTSSTAPACRPPLRPRNWRSPTATSIRGRPGSASAGSASRCIRICRSAGWIMSKNSAFLSPAVGEGIGVSEGPAAGVPARRVSARMAGRRAAICAFMAEQHLDPNNVALGILNPLTSGQGATNPLAVGRDHPCHQRMAEGRVDVAGQAAARLGRGAVRGRRRVGEGDRTARRRSEISPRCCC